MSILSLLTEDDVFNELVVILKKLQDKFTLTDISDMDIITFKNGKKAMLIGDETFCEIDTGSVVSSVRDYNHDLSTRSNTSKDLAIQSVRRSPHIVYQAPEPKLKSIIYQMQLNEEQEKEMDAIYEKFRKANGG